MKTKSKLLLIVTLMLLGLGLANLVNIFLNFRNTSISNAVEKSKMAANIVKDGLTAHMVNGIMPERGYFLKQISTNEEIKSLWIVRGENVTKQYGDGLIDESPKDSIDENVLRTGKLQKQLTEDINKMILRVTIPYIATKEAGVGNCISCHEVKNGDTLGAISMEFDISTMRTEGAITLFKIMGINLLFIIFILFLINYYISPFTKLFSNLQNGIKKAYTGDFTHKFTTSVGGEAGNIVKQMNALFGKMQETFGDVRHSLAVFAPKNGEKSNNPLDEANEIIHELSDIYKFKKTIELDISKDVVYTRVVNIFKEKYNIKHFALYEINDKKRTRQLIHLDGRESICYASVDEN
ncbi:MAG: GGDEF domain-containing protein, partial [Campylobacterota bacterium]|nr:GGDEF domain-containing protein [Campylobacterota bacterium]